MLKALFSSNTRVKLLKKFLLHPEEEFYGRDLSRELDEQIHSVRRELNNLEKIGLLQTRWQKNILYFKVSKKFSIYPELKSIFKKSDFLHDKITEEVKNIGKIQLLLFSGIFIGKKDSRIDLLIVGEVDRDSLEKVIEKHTEKDENIRYSVLPKKNFLDRLEFKDQFSQSIINEEESIITINSIKDELKKYKSTW